MTLTSWPLRLTWLRGLGFLITPAMQCFLWWKREHVYFSSRSIFSPYWLSGSFYGHQWSMRRFNSHWEEVSWVLGKVSHTTMAGLEEEYLPFSLSLWLFVWSGVCSVALTRMLFHNKDQSSGQGSTLRLILHASPPAQSVMLGHSISKSCCADSWFREWKKACGPLWWQRCHCSRVSRAFMVWPSYLTLVPLIFLLGSICNSRGVNMVWPECQEEKGWVPILWWSNKKKWFHARHDDVHI